MPMWYGFSRNGTALHRRHPLDKSLSVLRTTFVVPQVSFSQIVLQVGPRHFRKLVAGERS